MNEVVYTVVRVELLFVYLLQELHLCIVLLNWYHFFKTYFDNTVAASVPIEHVAFMHTADDVNIGVKRGPAKSESKLILFIRHYFPAASFGELPGLERPFFIIVCRSAKDRQPCLQQNKSTSRKSGGLECTPT